MVMPWPPGVPIAVDEGEAWLLRHKHRGGRCLSRRRRHRAAWRHLPLSWLTVDLVRHPGLRAELLFAQLFPWAGVVVIGSIAATSRSDGGGSSSSWRRRRRQRCRSGCWTTGIFAVNVADRIFASWKFDKQKCTTRILFKVSCLCIAGNCKLSRCGGFYQLQKKIGTVECHILEQSDTQWADT